MIFVGVCACVNNIGIMKSMKCSIGANISAISLFQRSIDFVNTTLDFNTEPTRWQNSWPQPAWTKSNMKELNEMEKKKMIIMPLSFCFHVQFFGQYYNGLIILEASIEQMEGYVLCIWSIWRNLHTSCLIDLLYKCIALNYNRYPVHVGLTYYYMETT